ncbi:proteasome (prosome, macropain) subunit, beta type 7 [Rattus norvegicus]|uniref:Proteasome (Prosome, macropain) subunit, beta type 7 n=1 Tax=Rattus norvegicus TaxID=10116 RepID=A6JEU7_RAT|nr:proteasome (prosome, macropain) subunit, beta type 7 [Rattus norvegicus]
MAGFEAKCSKDPSLSRNSGELRNSMPNKASSKFAPPFHPVPQLRRKCKFFLVAPPSARKHFLGKMAAVSVFQAPVGGFSFDNCRRNAVLEADFAKKGFKLPKARKTGTTIAGVVYKDGIVLGADTRATEGMVVADKNCSKIHFISPNIYRYQGYIGAALVLGGVDVTGPHLYSIYPHGSTDKLPYVTMGSGSLAAMAVFEDKFRPDMEEEEAKKLVSEAIAAGIFNDLGSGSNIDLCVISKSKLDFLRPYSVPNKKGTRFGRYRCEKGTTAVLTEKVTPLELEVLEEIVQTMDTS